MTTPKPPPPPRPPTAPAARSDLATLLARLRGRELRLDGLAPAPRPPRMLLLWVLSAPLVPAALFALAAGHLRGFLGDALGWGLIAAAAWLTRRDAGAAGAPDRSGARRFSRRLRLPLRNLAALALGLGTSSAAIFGAAQPPAVGLIFGLLAVLGYHLTWGLAPLLEGQRLPGSDQHSRQVASALAEAEGRLISIERAAAAIDNAELRLRLTRIAAQGRAMLEQIAARPSDLRRARRFLTVFLEGAEQVSDGYVRTHRQANSPQLEQNFRNVLISIEEQFIRQRERLREADVLDLDVQIEVLRKQLEQEGIR